VARLMRPERSTPANVRYPSTASGYEDIAGTHEMRVIGEFIERIDPSRYDSSETMTS